jgi:hypothetical protein
MTQTEPVVEYVFDAGAMSMLIIVGDFTGKNINESKAVDAAVNGMSRNPAIQQNRSARRSKGPLRYLQGRRRNRAYGPNLFC